MSDTIPEPDAAATPDLATLAIIYRFPEAAVLISMLRAYGIAAFAPAWNFAAMNWHMTVAIGGIAVVVPAPDLEAAITLVGDPRELPLPRRNFRCGPLCNAILALAMLTTFGVPLPLPARAKGSYVAAPRA